MTMLEQSQPFHGSVNLIAAFVSILDHRLHFLGCPSYWRGIKNKLIRLPHTSPSTPSYKKRKNKYFGTILVKLNGSWAVTCSDYVLSMKLSPWFHNTPSLAAIFCKMYQPCTASCQHALCWAMLEQDRKCFSGCKKHKTAGNGSLLFFYFILYQFPGIAHNETQ